MEGGNSGTQKYTLSQDCRERKKQFRVYREN